MTDYSKMSDFEINKLVAESHRVYWHLRPNSVGNDSWIYCDYYSECDTNNGEIAITLPDYCNNPSDAWPIILSNFIALKPVKWYVAGYRWFASKGDGDFGLKFADDNPLRAAMVVYLMMKESENG